MPASQEKVNEPYHTLRPWCTWTDLQCGCSRSDRGSWIITTTCDVHIRLLTDNQRSQLPIYTDSHQVGPFRP